MTPNLNVPSTGFDLSQRQDVSLHQRLNRLYQLICGACENGSKTVYFRTSGLSQKGG